MRLFGLAIGLALLGASPSALAQRADAPAKARIAPQKPMAAVVRAEAQRLLARAHAAEPAVTGALEAAVSKTSGRLVGLEHRLKSVESLSTKLTTRTQSRVSHGMAAEDAVKREGEHVNDTLRYTVELSPDHYAESYTRIVQHLEAAGYRVDRGINAWMPDAKPFDGTYRGLNTIFRNGEGLLIEVQFHTPQSYALKMEIHPLYEEMRAPNTTAERRAEITRTLRERWTGTMTPAGAKEIRIAPSARDRR